MQSISAPARVTGSQLTPWLTLLVLVAVGGTRVAPLPCIEMVVYASQRGVQRNNGGPSCIDSQAYLDPRAASGCVGSAPWSSASPRWPPSTSVVIRLIMGRGRAVLRPLLIACVDRRAACKTWGAFGYGVERYSICSRPVIVVDSSVGLPGK